MSINVYISPAEALALPWHSATARPMSPEAGKNRLKAQLLHIFVQTDSSESQV